MADTNGNNPFAHTDKKSGDIIRSEDWNSAMNEVVRLNNAKVNRQGADTIQGPLTIEAALTLNDRVGIGGAPATGTNAERLKVTGNAAIAGSLTIQQNQSAVLELRAIDGAHGRHAYLVSRPNSFNAYSTDLGFKVRREAAWTSEALPDAMTIAYTGNVGIGIDTPTEKLDIKGGKLQLEGNQQILFKDGDTSNNLKLQLWSGYGLGINNGTLFYAANGIHSWRDDKGTNERMKLTTAANGGLTVLGTGKSSFAGALDVAGNVGVGTSSPSAKLEVVGSGGSSIDLLVNGRLRSNNNDGGLWVASDRFVGGHGTNKIGFYTNSAWRLTVTDNGNIGVGTSTPDKGKLHIEGSVNYQHPSGYRYFVNRTDSNQTTTGFNAPYSIYASNFIGASEFNAFSDLRIKEVEGVSDSASDLKILRQLSIVNYSYKDQAKNGSKKYKKVIGQQVAKVFPQSVDTHLDVIPDVFQKAFANNGWIELMNHGLQTGERIKIFLENSEGEIHIITAATPHRFQVSLDYTGTVFVYGREVDDFHVVDYDALSMLNISATQELCKIIDALQADISSLKKQISDAQLASLSVAFR
ncbi:tail fiber domain-containing protein [Nodosilinea sp. PGN35]|uniref:tail fiber domain-containing protein n=1 Tax=Nodosilinea sp. PGN35 TaxID=3020489 RepID=UPI0023B2EAF7|nr:tail fiber domain-containing protein [Nodosilinea sp. TSF1-S3]MDF0365788.1 tail fiber domain-containing protein [Nodosilinea sp. TSF1-S3]